MYEDDDYSWALPKPDEKIEFVPNRKYLIKPGNFWEVLTFIEFDPTHSVEFNRGERQAYPAYVFKGEDKNKSYFSENYVKELATKGFIKPYDPDFNWVSNLNIKKVEINKKGQPILKGGFVILFYNGIDIVDTYSLQKKLFELGFKWYNGKQEILDPTQGREKILTIESFNWDTSIYSYERMDSKQRDKKLLLLSAFYSSEAEREKQLRLDFLDHHDVEVIDGYDLISRI